MGTDVDILLIILKKIEKEHLLKKITIFRNLKCKIF